MSPEVQPAIELRENAEPLVQDTPNLNLRHGHKRLATLAAGVALLGAVETAQASELPAPAGGPKGQVGMSNERTETRWAYAAYSGMVRNWPSLKSKARSRLHLSAPDGAPEVYIVRSVWEDPRGRDWARIRIPARPKPAEGWVARASLGAFGVSHSAIRINREKMQLTLYEDGKVKRRAPVGVGRPGMATPAGNFWVQDRYRVTENLTFNLNGRKIPTSVFGPAILMTTAYGAKDNWPGGGTVGIHGTNEPWLVPGRPSHGCVRLHNKDISYVYKRAPLGTPIKIV